MQKSGLGVEKEINMRHTLNVHGLIRQNKIN